MNVMKESGRQATLPATASGDEQVQPFIFCSFKSNPDPFSLKASGFLRMELRSFRIPQLQVHHPDGDPSKLLAATLRPSRREAESCLGCPGSSL